MLNNIGMDDLNQTAPSSLNLIVRRIGRNTQNTVRILARRFTQSTCSLAGDALTGERHMSWKRLLLLTRHTVPLRHREAIQTTPR